MFGKKIFNFSSGITNNTVLFFRVVLCFTFTGHGLVSLGFSEGYELHHRIFESVNYCHWNAERFLFWQGLWDLALAAGILVGFKPKMLLSAAITYLCVVAVIGWLYFNGKTGNIFGFAESFRRFAWLFYAIFLWMFYTKQEQKFWLLRVGIGFAFLAHGLASLGFFGLKGAHIELASQVLSEEMANNIVYYSGYTDTLIGALLLSGFFSRCAAAVGTIWLIVVVYLSFLFGLPEGIFRTGFLLSCFYVALDKRCHETNLLIWLKYKLS
jgi:uncharacterized membrane protein YphA (DoxX/SURF4 family)